MKRLISTILLVLVAVGIFASASEARLSNNNRRAVVLECFYALRPSADGSCDKTITNDYGTWCVSNWNYLNSDTNFYLTVRNIYSCSSSNWTTSGDGSPCYNNNSPASFWTNYGYNYGYYGSYGRGGQCKYFANLILYRSGSAPQALPPYPGNITSNSDYDTNMQNAVEGDILVTLNEGSNYNVPHTAIVVEIKRSGTTVTGLDVIDANYVSDINHVANREVISRHLLSISTLQQHSYGIWKKVSYYGEQYAP